MKRLTKEGICILKNRFRSDLNKIKEEKLKPYEAERDAVIAEISGKIKDIISKYNVERSPYFCNGSQVNDKEMISNNMCDHLWVRLGCGKTVVEISNEIDAKIRKAVDDYEVALILGGSADEITAIAEKITTEFKASL